VHFNADTMPEAMSEVLAVARFVNYATRGSVDVAASGARPHEVERGVLRVKNDLVYLIKPDSRHRSV
jgi:hypothetical protein